MTKYPKRKRIRLRRELYNNSAYAFLITICTYQRRKLFLNNAYADFVHAQITGHLARTTSLYASSLLPDHLHLLLSPVRRNLIDVIGSWKAYTTNELHTMGHDGHVWQTGFYDHVLRNKESLIDVGNYILANPVRLGLCSDQRDYQYNFINPSI
jgi:REP element-mobilizing transposase RayT